MQDNFVKIFKATIIAIIVALLFSATAIWATIIIAGDEIDLVLSTVSRMSFKETEEEQTELALDKEKNRLETYPKYGSKYAELKIESVGIDLPVYFGDTNEILKLGIGHYAGSYFPGEGGAILYAGHNTKGNLRTLPDVEIGDIINISTNYGEFNYKIYNTQVIHQSEEEKLPIQEEEEIFMIYTCYPVTGVGHKSHRFVAYAKPTEEK